MRSATSLARVEMTSSDGKPIAGDGPRTAGEADAAPTTGSRAGREYELNFNTTAFNSSPVAGAGRLGRIRQGPERRRRSPIPSSRFEIEDAPAPSGGQRPPRRRPPDSLDPPHRPGARRRQGPSSTSSSESLANNRDLLFERITKFGGTVAGETRTLALIATVASWLIIIAYLWWRFHSFTYGFAAVLAVVHDVLITLGALAVSYWLAMIPGISTLLPDRSVQDRPADRRGLPHPDRLLGQRHDRDLRPHPGDQGEDAAPDQQDGQRRHQPDVEPDDPHLVHRLAGRRHPLPLRRRGTARVRLRPGRRLPERDLQHGLYRHADPDRLRRHQAGAPLPRPASNWRPCG